MNFDEPETKPRSVLIQHAVTRAPPPEHKRHHVAKPSEVVADGLQPTGKGESSLLTHTLAQIEQSANEGDVQGACLRLEQFLRAAPTHAEAWYLHGVLASALDDLARAEASLARAAYLNPGHAPTLRLRAELARRSGDGLHAERLHARLKRVRHARGGA